ncbi:hypothetical protein Rumeso_03123 [Rubellimicrobium mesophilum DSM 19309]|uniref:Uncharacterized protein n=1 Tax=Rubellimicrobium mesophilum DSM 19309 TaxID=442562 RepID=A0A017HND6_9RHOB|nr:hypothetical protein Rumeso_03123 [Rubellimicrobium mesophilum DSM 19309]
MPARPALIKQADLTRIAKAMRLAGVTDWRADIGPSGTVSIIAGKSSNNHRKCDWD